MRLVERERSDALLAAQPLDLRRWRGGDLDQDLDVEVGRGGEGTGEGGRSPTKADVGRRTRCCSIQQR